MQIPWLVAVIGCFLIAIELHRPGRRLPKVRRWWSRALFFNGRQAGIIYACGATLDPWLAERRVGSVSSLGVGTGASAILGYVVLTFVYYWWHRARHQVPFLWRWFHQFHHSPRRIEVLTSFYKHPSEIAANAVLSSGVMYLLLGLSPAGAAGATLLSGLAELFYHWNVRTPYWIGYLVQRPESHCVHHERGIHHYNYGDLPLWDALFGTFHNPRRWEGECGLGAEAELRVADMLYGRDVLQTP